MQIELSKEEINVIINGLNLILCEYDMGTLDISENAKDWYEKVKNKFETIKAIS